MTPSFKRGCTGPIVYRLQEKLKVVRPDGIFGKNTQAAIRKAQEHAGLPADGNADKRTFDAIGIQWPDWWLRCMNFTSALEGTSFGGMNRRDIDGWGITLGIVGFTSRNGEVQSVFKKAYAQKPQIAELLPLERRAEFVKLLATTFKSTSASNIAWCEFAYWPSGYLREDIREMVHVLGSDPIWQRIQLDMAHRTYWLPAADKAKAMGLTSMAGYGLLYDTWVQNGGWRDCHQKFYMTQSQDANEVTKLRAIARAAANCATSTWRDDVLRRKMVFVETAGVVHGSFFDLSNYGYEGVD
jgi:hypothetical protein